MCSPRPRGYAEAIRYPCSSVAVINSCGWINPACFTATMIRVPHGLPGKAEPNPSCPVFRGIISETLLILTTFEGWHCYGINIPQCSSVWKLFPQWRAGSWSLLIHEWIRGLRHLEWIDVITVDSGLVASTGFVCFWPSLLFSIILLPFHFQPLGDIAWRPSAHVGHWTWTSQAIEIEEINFLVNCIVRGSTIQNELTKPSITI